MDSFQRFAPQARFQPRAVADVASALEAESQRRLSDLQRYQGQQEQRAQNRIVDSQVPNRTMQALSQFSETAFKYVEDYAKRTAKDIEIGNQYDALTQGIDLPTAETEGELIEVGEAQNQQLSRIEGAVSESDPIAGQQIRQARQIGEGLSNEKALLNEAKSAYPAEITAFANSNELVAYGGVLTPASQLLRSTDPDAVAAVYRAARAKFIKDRNLQYTTKTNFVNILGDTMLATDGYMTTNAVTANIKAEQQATIAYNESAIQFDIQNNGLGTLAQAQANWNSYTEQMLNQNTGLSQRAVNARVVKAMARGLIERGDEEGLVTLELVQQVPDQAGTELGRLYSREIQEAKIEAYQKKNQAEAIEAQQIVDAMNEQLSVEGLSSGERTAIAQTTAEQLRDLKTTAGYKQAESILGNLPTLVLSNDSRVNDALLEQELRDGIISKEKLDAVRAGYLSGRYSEKAYKDALDTYNQKEKAALPEVKQTVKSIKQLWENKTLIQLGLKRDDSGLLNIAGLKLGYVNKDHVSAITRAFQRDLEVEKDRILRSINSDDPSELSSKLDTELQKWVDKTTSKGGKYYLGGVWEAESYERTSKEGKKKYQKEFDKFLEPDYRTAPATVAPQNLSYNYIQGGELTEAAKVAYRPMVDTVFESEELDEIATQWKEGVVNEKLASLSEDLGVSPLQLLNDNLLATGEEPLQIEAPKNLKTSVGNAGQGMVAFQQVGFPRRSAAYLAATVAAVTGWENPGDLKMETWIDEMRLINPEALATLLNPNSSKRHLQGAIAAVFGEQPGYVGAAANLLIS